MPKNLDPFWEYGIPDGGTNRAYLSCKLCGDKMTGGVTRLKYHLARLLGHDVGICKVSSPELIRKALEAIEEKDRKKEEAERNKAERAGRSFGISSPDFDVQGRGPTVPSGRGSTTGTPSHASATASVNARSSFFVPRTGAGAEPGIKSLVKKRRSKKQIESWGGVFFGATYLSASRKPIHIGSQCVMLLLLWAQGTKVPHMRSCGGQFFKQKKRTSTLDWRS